MSAPRKLDARRLLDWPFRDVRVAFDDRDTILYSLAVGLGSDPLDRRQLRYVYEKDLKAFATMPMVLGMAEDVGFLTDPQVGIDLPRMLHGETGLELHRPLPARGEVISRLSIDRLIDRGEGRGAILYWRRSVRDAASGELCATETGSFFLRGNGGFGGESGSGRRMDPVPDRSPDLRTDLATLPQSALLYRLTGDDNPLHADPSVSAQAGFERPILHGACTFGFAVHGLARLLCDYDSDRIRAVEVRFTAPVLPGETLCVEVWRTGPGLAAFRVRVPRRDLTVIDNGICRYQEER